MDMLHSGRRVMRDQGKKKPACKGSAGLNPSTYNNRVRFPWSAANAGGSSIQGCTPRIADWVWTGALRQ